MTPLLTDTPAPHVRLITMNRPEALNAMTAELCEALHGALAIGQHIGEHEATDDVHGRHPAHHEGRRATVGHRVKGPQLQLKCAERKHRSGERSL